MVDGEERDSLMTLFDTLEDAYSIDLYWFKQVDGPLEKLEAVDIGEDLRSAFFERK